MKELYDTIGKMQSSKRYQHTLGVIKLAKQLGELYNVDVRKCELAALLHDVTKEVDADTQRKYLNGADELTKSTPALWHSYTGAKYINSELGINDEEIYEAVKYHTTGYKDASPLTMIIYISDYLEEGRKHDSARPLRDQIGVVSLRVLYEQVAQNRIEFEMTKNITLHALTKELYESIV